VLYLVSIGKEASVYCCAAGEHLAAGMSRRLTGWKSSPTPNSPSPPAELRPEPVEGRGPGGEVSLVAAKVYRARQYRFKNDAVYQEERTRGMRGQAVRALAKKTEFGRKVQTGSWVGHEYEVLKELHDAGCDVPRPLASAADAILIEFVGDEDGPRPSNRVELPADAEAQFERVLRTSGSRCPARVHGDLSAHNILWWDGQVVLIDFPQAVDARFNSQAERLLHRDIENVCRYFAQFGVKTDAWSLAHDLWRRYTLPAVKSNGNQCLGRWNSRGFMRIATRTSTDFSFFLFRVNQCPICANPCGFRRKRSGAMLRGEIGAGDGRAI
jgi:RIO kinase 1